VSDRRYRLATVFAHPDDDAYQVGGWIAMHAADTDLTMVFCTSGDAGPIWVEGAATRETLGSVRESEQRAFLGAVGAEHADVQGESATRVFLDAGRWTDVRDHQDPAGRPRYTTARLAR